MLDNSIFSLLILLGIPKWIEIYNVEQTVQFILKPGDESELSNLDEDDDHDETSACNNYWLEIEDDIEEDDISEEQVSDNHRKNTFKEKSSRQYFESTCKENENQWS